MRLHACLHGLCLQFTPLPILPLLEPEEGKVKRCFRQQKDCGNKHDTTSKSLLRFSVSFLAFYSHHKGTDRRTELHGVDGHVHEHIIRREEWSTTEGEQQHGEDDCGNPADLKKAQGQIGRCSGTDHRHN